MLDALNRRALLQVGAAAAGTLALGSGAVPGYAADPPPQPLEGGLTAWVVVHPERGAEIRLAHFGTDGKLAGQGDMVWVPAAGRVSAWGQAQSACAQAQRLAVAAAARSWRVPADACRVEPGRIVHPGTGSQIACRAWVDLA